MRIIYEKRDQRLESVNDGFIYSVDVYLVYPDRSELHSSKYIKANKEIKKYKSCVFKKMDGYKMIKYVNFIAAPLSYLEENNFKKLEIYDRREQNKRKKNKNNE